MPLSEDARDLALAAILTGELQVALFIGDTEVSDIGYQRQPVAYANPKNGKSGNVAEVRFGPWQNDAPSALTHWALYRNGTFWGRTQMDHERPRQPYVGDVLIFAAGVLPVGIS